MLRLRYGIGVYEPMTLAEVAELPEFQVSRERIRQIELHALDRIRTNYKMRRLLSGYETVPRNLER